MAQVTKFVQDGFSIACELNAEACETQRGPGTACETAQATCTMTSSDGKVVQVQLDAQAVCQNLRPGLLVVAGFMWGGGDQSLNELWSLMVAGIVSSGAWLSDCLPAAGQPLTMPRPPR